MTIHDLVYCPMDPAGVHPRDADRIARCSRNIRRFWRSGKHHRRERYWHTQYTKARLRAMLNSRDIVKRDACAWNWKLDGGHFKTVGERMEANLRFARQEAGR